MSRLLERITNTLPYIAFAIAIATGTGSWFSIKYARLDGSLYIPRMEASLEWKSTTGVVLDHGIVKEVAGQFSHSPSSHYYAEVLYEYAVDGLTLRSNNVCLGHSNCLSGTDEEDAQALLESYPVGARVTVYYDPGTPELAALIPGNPESISRLRSERTSHLIWGISLALVTVILLIVTFKTAKEFKEDTTS